MHFTKSSNLDVMHQLNRVVKGQEQAKKGLITLANRSYLRYYQHYVKGMPLSDCVANKNEPPINYCNR